MATPSSTAPSSCSSSTSSQFTYANSSYFPMPFHLQHSAAAVPTPASQYTVTPYVAAPALPLSNASIYPAPATVGGAYSIPQFQQAQQLFQRDASNVRPEAIESVKAAIASSDIEHKVDAKKKAVPRKAAGQSWEDPTLSEWPENDYRVFVGDIGNEVNDDVLSKAFSRFPTFNMARVVRDKRTGKTKGYGFVSFGNPSDLAAAIKEMNGKYVGNRPIKLRKSNWKERIDYTALEKQKNQCHKKHKQTRKGILHK